MAETGLGRRKCNNYLNYLPKILQIFQNPVARVFQVVWNVFQPILFGLIGSEVDVFVLEGSVVGYGALSLLIALFARIVVSVFIAFGAGFTWKEKVFVAWAWFPKATVQVGLQFFMIF